MSPSAAKFLCPYCSFPPPKLVTLSHCLGLRRPRFHHDSAPGRGLGTEGQVWAHILQHLWVKQGGSHPQFYLPVAWLIKQMTCQRPLVYPISYFLRYLVSFDLVIVISRISRITHLLWFEMVSSWEGKVVTSNPS